MEAIRRLHGYHVVTTDGRVRRVRTTYVDDRHWRIRHFVVSTGHWLPGRDVLVPPGSVRSVDSTRRRLLLTLSKQDLEHRPGISTDRPVSRQRQIGVDDVYWYSVFPWPLALRAARDMFGIRRRDDRHLRSSRELLGYYVHARDQEIGHVADFLVDETSWRIEYAVVGTRNWLPGKRVLVPMEWMTSLSWGAATMYVDLSRSVIRNAPSYDPHHAINPQYERSVIDYYGHPKHRDVDIRWMEHPS